MKLFAILQILILLLFCIDRINTLLHKNNSSFSLSNNTKQKFNFTKRYHNKTKGNLKEQIKNNNNTITISSFIPEIYQFKEESKRGRNRLYAADYYSSIRNISLYISKENECTILVNDTITYNAITPSTFVEHMLLHNNADSIDPKGVYSEDIQINFFTFNKKLNVFETYFTNKHNLSSFQINYEYEANNLIKRNIVKHNTTNSTESYNSFIWKMVNQNYMKQNETFHIEIEFDLGKDFLNETVEFSMNFTKEIDTRRKVVKYIWEGDTSAQDVIIVKSKFPLYFKKCKTLKLNVGMIIVGSVFIMFLIGMLYFIVSTILLEKL